MENVYSWSKWEMKTPANCKTSSGIRQGGGLLAFGPRHILPHDREAISQGRVGKATLAAGRKPSPRGGRFWQGAGAPPRDTSHIKASWLVRAGSWIHLNSLTPTHPNICVLGVVLGSGSESSPGTHPSISTPLPLHRRRCPGFARAQFRVHQKEFAFGERPRLTFIRILSFPQCWGPRREKLMGEGAWKIQLRKLLARNKVFFRRNT